VVLCCPFSSRQRASNPSAVKHEPRSVRVPVERDRVFRSKVIVVSGAP
jgi:hypothetical protein